MTRHRYRLLPVLVLSLSLALSGTPTLASSPPQPSTETTAPALYIVFKEDESGGISPVSVQRVQMRSLQSMQASEVARVLSSESAEFENRSILLQSARGEVIYRNVVQIQRWIRGEFHGDTPDSEIDGYIFPATSRVFVVRVPLIPGGTLILEDKESSVVDRFSMSSLLFKAEVQGEQNFAEVLQDAITGDPLNRVDLLILGDGYTSAEESDYLSDANDILDSFFDISPYQEYANYFNSQVLFTPSNQSGSDHPPYDATCVSSDDGCCADTQMLSDPLQGTFVDTAFDSTFCQSNIHRLLWANNQSVADAAAGYPDWDVIILIVNDTTYGGGGGWYMTASMHNSSVQIAQHEFGHTFVKLADEYESPYPGYPPCSDISGPPCRANVTDVDVREQIKWEPWIEPTTLIPTVPENDPSYADLVGLFPGAQYVSVGMYRSGQNCIMRSLGKPYCQVPSQAFVLRLYGPRWGYPLDGISMIEPGSAIPTVDTLSIIKPQAKLFSAEILSPIGGPSPQITWSVNGSIVPGENDPSFLYSTSRDDPSPVTITLKVKDPTSLVHPDMENGELEFEHSWTVEILEGLYLPLIVK